METKECFREFDDVDTSLLDKVKHDKRKKLLARVILQAGMYEHINAKKSTSLEVYVYVYFL